MNKSESKYFNTATKMDLALISLLKKKPFDYITVSEICEEAGVGFRHRAIGFIGVNAFAFGTYLCRFDCNGNVGVIYLDITTEVLTQSIYGAFGKVCSVVYKG